MSTPDRLPISVCIIPLASGATLEACIRAIANQAADVVVLASNGERLADNPGIRFVGGENDPIPAKRMRGLQAAKLPFVAFLEDTCTPDEPWCAAMLEAFNDASVSGVCGPIEISRSLPPQQRALGVTEYARFQPRILFREGQERVASKALTGANFAVRKAALDGADNAGSFVDGALFERLRAHGGVIASAAAAVSYTGLDRRGARLSSRFHHGRIYGGTLSARQPLIRRALLAVKAALAPAVQMVRHCRDAPAWFWRSPATMLWVVAMNAAWGAGEALGAITGSAGRSLSRWS
jgi:hypothetical protein